MLKSYNLYCVKFIVFVLSFVLVIASADAGNTKKSRQDGKTTTTSRTKATKKKSSAGLGKCFATMISGKIEPCTKSPPASMVIDSDTGQVLHSEGATQQIYPASLTKVMTMYLLFEALESGQLHMNQSIPVSSYAASMPPGKLWFKDGEYIKVEDAIVAMVVKSANDVATAVGEKIAGSEQKFAKLMTKRAKDLGMDNTTFRNASGWHHPDQKTTAADLAKLAMAVKRDFPQYYEYFSRTSFVFKGNTIRGHNPLTAHYDGAEGMKTGFNNPSGFNIITTASNNGKSLIAIVTGSRNRHHRDNKVVALLDEHFGINNADSYKEKAGYNQKAKGGKKKSNMLAMNGKKRAKNSKRV